MHSSLTLDQRFDDPRFASAMLEKLPEYLANQRWFTSKGKAVTNCKIREAYPVTQDTALVVMEIGFGDDSTEFYQMPLAQLEHTDDQRRYLKDNDAMVLLRVPGGPFIVDAVPLPAFRRALYELVRRGADTPEGINCEAGRLLQYAPDSADSVVPSVDTSNTAIIYDDKYFFKLFRKLDPGLNPDLELVRYLSEETTFSHCPPYGGSLGVGEMTNENYLNLGMLSGKVDNQGDAWEYFQQLTQGFFAGDGTVGVETLARAYLLGERTAEMHLALGNSNQDDKVSLFRGKEPSPDDMLAPTPMSAEYRKEITEAARKLLTRQATELKNKVDELDPVLKALAHQVIDLEAQISERLGQLADAEMELDLIRIHADYHLGQVLVTENDFYIIDFEGEPLLSIPERRRRRPALKDVAGMIRSFHYAANGQLLLNPERYADQDQKKLAALANHWFNTVSATYLSAYYEHCGEASFLPAAPEDRQLLLDLFILEKAIYEVAYELNSRQAWLGIPLGGVLSVVG
jgi:maltose alpha-D-glucosyltransferase/alpha-amylase